MTPHTWLPSPLTATFFKPPEHVRTPHTTNSWKIFFPRSRRYGGVRGCSKCLGVFKYFDCLLTSQILIGWIRNQTRMNRLFFLAYLEFWTSLLSLLRKKSRGVRLFSSRFLIISERYLFEAYLFNHDYQGQTRCIQIHARCEADCVCRVMEDHRLCLLLVHVYFRYCHG